MKIAVELLSGPRVTFEVDENAMGRAFFVLGVRKSGSSFLNKLCASLARVNSIKYIDVAGTFFSNNVIVGDWATQPQVRKILRPGNAYGGFRNMPGCFEASPVFLNAKKVLLVRDPRDALVSEYFSNAYSHSLPDAAERETGARNNLLIQRRIALETSIDDYVISRWGLMASTLSDYKDIWSDPTTLKLRYEDVILKKRELARGILDFFRWTCPENTLVKILTRLDVVPSTENPTAFIRRVIPGDHKEKLSAATIGFLTEKLAPMLTHYGYSQQG